MPYLRKEDRAAATRRWRARKRAAKQTKGAQYALLNASRPQQGNVSRSQPSTIPSSRTSLFKGSNEYLRKRQRESHGPVFQSTPGLGDSRRCAQESGDYAAGAYSKRRAGNRYPEVLANVVTPNLTNPAIEQVISGFQRPLYWKLPEYNREERISSLRGGCEPVPNKDSPQEVLRRFGD